MKRIVWIIVAVAVAGYLFNSYVENKDRREAERAEEAERAAEEERIEKSTKAAVSEMASRMNAVTEWEANLSEPIITVELERLWLQQRPILFIGSIKDIATNDQSQYVVLVESSHFGGFGYVFGTVLQLSLLSDKNKIDSLLKEHRNLFKEYGFDKGVAVVALVSSIRTTYVPGWEGEQEQVKIGDGKLIDILYTGDVTF